MRLAESCYGGWDRVPRASDAAAKGDDDAAGGAAAAGAAGAAAAPGAGLSMVQALVKLFER